MPEEKEPIQEPQDDAIVVHENVPDEERAHKELVDKVAKKLNRDEYGMERSSEEKTDAVESVETPAEETVESKETPPKKGEKPALSKEIQTRAEKAGLTNELVERLHESGQLEETLTAFDRVLIERFQAKEPEEPKKAKEDTPELDPDIYDEDLVKRDAYHKQRIDSLEAQIESLIQDRQDQFDEWFDGVLTEMGYDIKDEDKCQKTFKAYKGICEAHGVSPEKRDPSLVERAHAAMFPEEVRKKAQQETVDRLRDAEGKFLSSSQRKGTPPAKDLSPEESHDQLVSRVTSYLKKQGVQMSGM